MKTIKIIDLLNLIANKEYDKLPKKVKYDESDFYWKRDIGDYRKDGLFECLIMRTIFTFDSYRHNSLYNMLFDEVEIIEDTKEDKKIEKLGKIEDNDGYIDQSDVIKIAKKVDEVIERLNEVEDNENK